MKNQYFGDINDYLKYGMLRAFARELSIAVIWMMTPDDGSGDGRKLRYLESGGRRGHDPELFDWLRQWQKSGGPRDVRLIEESGLLPNCRFFSEIVPDDVGSRDRWLQRAREFARGSGLVFLDPDNGLEVKSTRPGAKGWSKYVAFDDVKTLFEDGHSLLIYQHIARTKRREFLQTKARELYEHLGEERLVLLMTFDWVGILLANWGHELALSATTRRILLEWDTAIHSSETMLVPVTIPGREIQKRRKESFRKHLDRQSTTIGFVNRNRQEVIARTDVPGNDHGQRVYVLRCGACSAEYGANGSDIHLRKCPSCQGGANGLPIA